ncbi:uncharacterized protein EI97DRAFT_453649 [Westerdykella ornata]|uniref:DUF2415 domain-containing protein n=1 Tax=Westerdykella ornata TaxID=318751 RepID=A0A6A6J4X3_WESOR|nr:uncharacterized protein EI97DRAFT_453649 [Westerdykella ornata]KAF2271495.1 hypothetical protein EI97DRAFT_453649 [Westerdykella ornata]
MAVDDFSCCDTDAFVLPATSLYPVKIPIAHYQLRHYISSPEQDLIYYASGTEVYCLNVAAKTQVHLTTLPWEARCTASGHGYVCVAGADHGNFAAIKVKRFPPSGSTDVDASLPLGFASRATTHCPPTTLVTAERVRLEKIGEDIVNSISIHEYMLGGNRPKDVVAVLTNNDKTVRIYSLTRGLEITVLDLPFPMNHGTISPDGQLLVAVGDRSIAFFFQKSKPPKSGSTRCHVSGDIEPQWSLLQEVRLYVPPASLNEGYFTTAWSPSGRLCAVGSECGYISVFDVELLKICEFPEDSVVQKLSSTRPDVHNGPGSVRTMQFSPAPWDLLIWSEDQARVCVADLRSNLKVKQVLTLDPKQDGLERLDVSDFDTSLMPELEALQREAEFLRRYHLTLDNEGAAAAVNFAAEYIAASTERRRLHRRLGVVDSDDDPHGLTAEERQIIDALRSTREREAGTETGIAPRSIHYRSSSPGLAQLLPQPPQVNSHSEGEESASRRANEDRLLAQINVLARRSPQHDLLRLPTSATEPSRTTSTHDGSGQGSPNLISTHLRRLEAQMVSSTDEAWRTIEEALARTVRGGDSTGRSAAAAAADVRTERRVRQLTQMRERLRSVRQADEPFESFLQVSYRAGTRSSHDPANGLRTAGLAMSQDGRTLYCGTTEGIFEFPINVQERRSFPAVKPR